MYYVCARPYFPINFMEFKKNVFEVFSDYVIAKH